MKTLDAMRARLESLDTFMLIDVIDGLSLRTDEAAEDALSMALDVLSEKIPDDQFVKFCASLEKRMAW